MNEVETIKKAEEIDIEEVINQEKTKKEVIFMEAECNRKSSRYPEGRRPHY
ncbi:MAG: hypothetical protein UV37_C0001G0040 [Candidatus Collierbacteria bacterium GW2011_GWA1_42_60]|uniref:Uncharacterized protein n=1 Tax=Candidatus Collierbacteria bacterium GW2011_GWA2_42_17 TaxID=1618378 RepID=A0A0G0Z2P2_9BACT|nr:MAG: hypothetical protein UU94_C0003G0024 [Candidatus Collierbacteria bacterium GW2011_GWB2_42_12]KKS43037.1 MAG: hypothetical protein UV06_C0003G0038 [Candidatus Collierbacteria bacterium GW2011_GWA2_42_17]KKS62919.1 MAG: hypothetical protein UV28_C0003G0017 [Candidatus Collierbacteria bacterium GW2011_GWE2_42_48]KKS63466.1 MAG: hypothetical protein UV29_C0001G0023 [Candidatus Collierbacteria bacterium GW2011_GWD2_42_50]KKS64542.1 MAG: hypothetical protein UV32_C0012G0026 [Candidatus Collie